MVCVHSNRGKPNLLDMGSLLIKPVQRIMKYPLLLGELWHATPEDHPDYHPLQEAFTTAKIINVNINEFKRRKDIGEIPDFFTPFLCRLYDKPSNLITLLFLSLTFSHEI